jgi:tRNA G18 (ribose-2'-O)-methylase SpoU
MNMSRELVVIDHDIRSTHNVGSLLRTCEGLGVQHIYFTGYTPYPRLKNDPRLPHQVDKLSSQIHKTALGAEESVPWTAQSDIHACLNTLRSKGFTIVGLEQSETSIALPGYHPPEKVALLLGREVEGIEADLMEQCDELLEIPMFGQKESFNVVQAAAMTLYHLRFGTA